MQTTESKEEIKNYTRMSKEEDEIQSKNEQPNSQMQLISQQIRRNYSKKYLQDAQLE